MKAARTVTFDHVFNISLTKQDRQALADRARLENKSSNEIARLAIRHYLTYVHPKRESAAA